MARKQQNKFTNKTKSHSFRVIEMEKKNQRRHHLRPALVFAAILATYVSQRSPSTAEFTMPGDEAVDDEAGDAAEVVVEVVAAAAAAATT